MPRPMTVRELIARLSKKPLDSHVHVLVGTGSPGDLTRLVPVTGLSDETLPEDGDYDRTTLWTDEPE